MNSLLLIFIFKCISFGIFHTDNSQDLALNARIVNSGWTDLFPGKFYCVKLIVQNNTDSTIVFSMFSCSWQRSFVLDIDSMDFLYQECPSNVPITVNLPPKDSLEFTTMLYAISPAFENDSFRIGLVPMTEKELKTPIFKGNPKNVTKARQLERKYLLTRKIYWSNPLYLKDRPLGYNFKYAFIE